MSHMTKEELALAERIIKWAQKRGKWRKLSNPDLTQGYARAMGEIEGFMEYLIEGPPDGTRDT